MGSPPGGAAREAHAAQARRQQHSNIVEMIMDVNGFAQSAAATLVAVGWKVVGAFVLWLVGRWLISFATTLVGRSMERQQLDATLTLYLQRSLGVVLNVVLIAAILGFFGVETTSFAALLAAGGVAIGVAWGGLLANFAAGAFLVFLRPFKIGDFVSAGGVTGTVDAIGLFGTTINTPDNVRTIVGNNKVFSDNIQNFSANPYRRVDLTALIHNSVDHRQAIALLKERLARVPNVLADPAPDVDILQFTPAGPQLCVRPYCATASYWQVYFDTNRLIRETFGEAGYPAPMPGYVVSGSLTPLDGGAGRPAM
jgi:small conductance mechanosensitive channel